MNVFGVFEENSRPFRCTRLSLAIADTMEKWNILKSYYAAYNVVFLADTAKVSIERYST